MSEPLTPHDCDCRGLPFMPLEVQRLMDSDFTALSTGDEFKAGFILWAKSWTQVPAGSIPDDDRILAHWIGRSLNEWQSVKEMALRGWVKCSDGRLYHPVIADLALAASQKRRGQAAKANSRWSRVRAEKAAKNAETFPLDDEADAAAQILGAEKMQGTVKVEEKESPLTPLGGKFEEAWKAFPDTGRKRSSRPKAKASWGRVLKAAGGEARLLEAVECYASSPDATKDGGQFVPGFHRWLADGKWEHWLPAVPTDPLLPFPEATLDPWRSRCQDFAVNNWWEPDWGPRPGREGCEVPAAMLAEFGISEGHPDMLRRKAMSH